MNSFDKVIGYESVKDEVARICDVVKNSDKYRKLGVKLPSGLLLHGDPGLGKTLIANCFLEESGRKTFVCRKNLPSGEFVKYLKGVFEDAKNNAPSIVMLDDFDKFANEDEDHKNAEEYVTVQSCIDENKNRDVFVVATANELSSIPRSLLRAGRFDTTIEVGKPKGEDSEKIIKHYLSTKKVAPRRAIESLPRICGKPRYCYCRNVYRQSNVGYER